MMVSLINIIVPKGYVLVYWYIRADTNLQHDYKYKYQFIIKIYCTKNGNCGFIPISKKRKGNKSYKNTKIYRDLRTESYIFF